LKLISSTLAEKHKAKSFAIDGGVLYHLNNISFGISLQNFGPGLKYEMEKSTLPHTLRIGISTSLKEKYDINLELMASINYIINQKTNFAFGCEYYLIPQLALRLGYKTGYENQGLSLGFGITIPYHLFPNFLNFDYAYVPIKDLDSAHKVSISIKF